MPLGWVYTSRFSNKNVHFKYVLIVVIISGLKITVVTRELKGTGIKKCSRINKFLKVSVVFVQYSPFIPKSNVKIKASEILNYFRMMFVKWSNKLRIGLQTF